MTYNAAAAIQMSRHLFHNPTPPRTLSIIPDRIVKTVKELWDRIRPSYFLPPIICTLKTSKELATIVQDSTFTLDGSTAPDEPSIDGILQYIQKNPQKEPTIIRSEKSGLGKTLYFDGKTWYLFLTKTTKQSDILLGEGSYKKVKYAIDLATGTRYALGVMRTNGDKSLKDVAEKEIKQHQRFNGISPHIVNLHTSVTFKYVSFPFKVTEKTYLILDECDRGDLFDLIRRGPLDHSQALTLASDCAKGLEKIHKENTIHRDVKTENIFLYTDEKGDTRAKVGDFGFCCDASDEEEKKQRAGTMEQFSPERALAFLPDSTARRSPLYSTRRSISATTTTQDDIWALGLSYFSLFSPKGKGGYPTCLYSKTGENGRSMLTQIAEVTQKEINECINKQIIDPTVPPELKTLISSMLSIDPQKRPSATEVAKTLEDIQTTKTV